MSDLRPGLELDGFRLEAHVATGGTAEIWRARGPQGGFCALKILLACFRDRPEYRQMFADEAKINARLRHPNIAEVYGAGAVDGVVFASMEWLDGADLKTLMKGANGRVPPEVAVLIAIEAARGLHAAHQATSVDGRPFGIVHRDVSPANLMLTPSGGVKVIDFGIAVARERQSATAHGLIKGKPHYMAPEQALGESVTALTDVYALGLTLWQMLTGHRANPGVTDVEAMAFASDPRVPPVQAHNASVSETLAATVSRMLRVDARERPRSMRAVEYGLTRLLEAEFGHTGEDLCAVRRWIASACAIEAATEEVPRGHEITAFVEATPSRTMASEPIASEPSALRKSTTSSASMTKIGALLEEGSRPSLSATACLDGVAVAAKLDARVRPAPTKTMGLAPPILERATALVLASPLSTRASSYMWWGTLAVGILAAGLFAWVGAA